MRLTRRHWRWLRAGRGAPPSDDRTPEGVLLRRLSGDREMSLRLGGGEPVSDAAERGGENMSSDRLRLLRAADAMDLVVDVFEAPAAWVAAARLDIAHARGTLSTVAVGKGFTVARAVLACLAEAVEKHGAVFRAADAGRLVDAATRAGPPLLDAGAVLGFSPAQIRDRARLNRRWDGWDAVPPPRWLRDASACVELDDADGQGAALCPAFLCYARFGEATGADPSLDGDGNGCAAGATVADARLRAALELAERDAAGIWWLRGCMRRRLAVDDAGLAAAAGRHVAETGRPVWFLDISSIRGVAAIACVSCDEAGECVALGFGCAAGTPGAMRSAFLEMVQTELSIIAHRHRLGRRAPGEPAAGDRRLARWLRGTSVATAPFLLGVRTGAAGLSNRAEAPPDRFLAEIAAAGGAGLWFADLGRAEHGVPVARAVCPGLAHFKQRLGVDRLWSVPERQGWRTSFGRHTRRQAPPLLV